MQRDWRSWEVLIRDHHEGYISWAEFERNQQLIADNANGKRFMSRGAIRPGEALLPGLLRCARCGNLLSLPVADDSRCSRCGVDLHSCLQCVSFDTSARFECANPSLAARVSPKDSRNDCQLFAPRTTVERQTGTAGPTSARQAFDDLFK